MEDRIIIQTEAIQETIIEPLSKELSLYFVFIVAGHTVESPMDMHLIGSGTLIQFKGTYFVLTADHVMKPLIGREFTNHWGFRYIGFVPSYPSSEPHKIEPIFLDRNKIPSNYFKTIARHPEQEIGGVPD